MSGSSSIHIFCNLHIDIFVTASRKDTHHNSLTFYSSYLCYFKYIRHVHERFDCWNNAFNLRYNSLVHPYLLICNRNICLLFLYHEGKRVLTNYPDNRSPAEIRIASCIFPSSSSKDMFSFHAVRQLPQCHSRCMFSSLNAKNLPPQRQSNLTFFLSIKSSKHTQLN